MLVFLLCCVSLASTCAPATSFISGHLEKWVEDGGTTTSTEDPILPTPSALVATAIPEGHSLTWRQISSQQKNSYRPGAESFSEIYRRLEKQNMQHLVAVEPEGQRPSGIFT